MHKKQLIISAVLIGAALAFSAAYAWQQTQSNSQQISNNSNGSTESTPTPTPASNGDVSNETEGNQQGQAQAVDQTIQLYLVALEDNGQGGQQIGCGDSLVPVNKTLHTATPLADAVRELLAIKDEHYGQSGLYNSLWKSSVHLDSASISNGVATVKLSGDLTLSGECDNPRVLEQLKATITQFDSVNSATILLNDQPLSEALALQ